MSVHQPSSEGAPRDTFAQLSSALVRALLALYRVVNQTGALDHRLGQAVYLGTYRLYKRVLEDPLHGLVRARPELFANGHILDVGANVGYTAQVLAEALSPGFRLFAFEPDARCFGMLTRSVARLERCVPVHAAVGSTDGTVSFWHNSAHLGDHRVATEAFLRSKTDEPRVEVPLVTLDRFLAQRGADAPIAFVKIDVQGYELAVCEGMRGILEKNERIAVALEYCPAMAEEMGFPGEGLLDFFEVRGFSASLITKTGGPQAIDRREIAARVSEQEYLNLLFEPGDLHA